MWKQCPFGPPPCWHTACSISLARVVREYLDCSNVGVARDLGLLAVSSSPEYGSKEKYGSETHVTVRDLTGFPSSNRGS